MAIMWMGMKGPRGVLLACNVILMLIALACIGGGIVLIVGNKAYGSELEFLRAKLSETAPGIRANDNLDVSDLDVRFVTFPLGITLLVTSNLIMGVCILAIYALIGQFYTKKYVRYAVLLGCLLFSQIFVTICAYVGREVFDITVKQYLKFQLQEYSGIDGVDSYTLGWNAIMAYMACCGVDDYTDFRVAGLPRREGGSIIQTPQICCFDAKILGAAPACANTENFQHETFYNRGCYNLMWDYVTTNSVLIIATIFGIVLLECFCLILAVWIIKRQSVSRVGDYEQYNE